MYFPKTDAIIDSRNKSINHAKNIMYLKLLQKMQDLSFKDKVLNQYKNFMKEA